MIEWDHKSYSEHNGKLLSEISQDRVLGRRRKREHSALFFFFLGL